MRLKWSEYENNPRSQLPHIRLGIDEVRQDVEQFHFVICFANLKKIVNMLKTQNKEVILQDPRKVKPLKKADP